MVNFRAVSRVKSDSDNVSNSTSISLFSEEVREKEIEISITSSDFNICDTNYHKYRKTVLKIHPK